ncbi:hypothetical protein BKA56DRAFT_599574 [Ilyonectria sp. MPI-CAGE-AT-0026]|nr:hypothetical protein BKA56DRAFT_599574 [Ilyonectria sp. MPI-CAGE-AT-0026]
MPESTIAPSASGEGAAWKMILRDNSTWLKEMTKLGYRLHLLSSDFDKLHDQNQTSNASQVFLVLVIESSQTKDGDADQNDHPPLREKFFKELRTHDWQNEMGRDILLKHSGIILNVSTYYVNGDVQSPFADFTRLCRKKEAAPGDEGQTRSRLRAVTYGTENVDVISWFFKGGYFFIFYEIDGRNHIWQFRPKDDYDFITQAESTI